MITPITLPVGASAEPETCGSCKFFKRGPLTDGPYEGSSGDCGIRMPPQKEFYKKMTYEEVGESDRSPNWIKDTFGCDLYRADGKTYIVQRKVGS